MAKNVRRVAERGRTTLTCPACSSTFERFNSQICGSSVACSRKCAAALQPRKPRTVISFVCPECGGPFSRRKGQDATAKHCSYKCMAAARGRSMRGQNHPFWKGGISERAYRVRAIIRRRVQEIGRCEKCGATDNLQGHHKLSHSGHPELRDDPSNIEVLCSQCHAAEHPEIANAISIPRKRDGSYISCLECGTTRYVPRHLATKAKFCSKECQRTALHKSLRGRSRTTEAECVSPSPA
jgi:5-methylcytosine-specific restriction endonuclease McrA